MTLRLPPAENRTRTPCDDGARPARSSSTPALASSSLYLPIAARDFSSGIAPASDSWLAFTIIMNRIVVSSVGVSCERRASRPAIDTALDVFEILASQRERSDLRAARQHRAA